MRRSAPRYGAVWKSTARLGCALSLAALFGANARASLIPAWQQQWAASVVTGAGTPVAARELADGSVMVVGSGAVAIRYDVNGSILSTAVFSPPYFVPVAYLKNFFTLPASAVAIDSAGTIIVASCSDTSGYHSNCDTWLTAYDGETGQALWPAPAILNGPQNIRDVPVQILIGPDSNPVVIVKEDPQPTVLAAKFDRATGAPLWGPVVLFGGSDPVASMDSLGDVILGLTDLPPPSHSVQAIEVFKILGQTGAFAWGPSRVGGVTANHSIGALQTGADGDVFAAARGPSGHEVLKFSGSSGTLLWGPFDDGDSTSTLNGISVSPAGNVVLSTQASNHFTLTELVGPTGATLWGPMAQATPGTPSALTVAIAMDETVVACALSSGASELDTWKFAAATGTAVWGPLGIQQATGRPVLVIRSDAEILTAASISGNLVAWERDPASGSVGWGPTGFSATFAINGTVEDIGQAPDGSVLVTGYAALPAGYRWVTFKYDRVSGAALWGPVFFDPGASSIPYMVRADGAGNALVLGYDFNGPGLVVLKYAANDGSLLWKSTLINTGGFPRLAIDSAGGVAVVGSTTLGFGQQMSTTRISGTDGSVLWGPALFAAASDRTTLASDIAITPSGDVVVSGRADPSVAVPYEQWVTLEYSGATGTLLWGPALAGDAQLQVGSRPDLAITQEGDAIVVGGATIDPQATHMAAIKYSGASGQTIWGPTFAPGSGSYPYAAAVDSHGDVFAAGSVDHLSNSDFGTVKLRGADGAVLWGPQAFDGPAGGSDTAYAIALDGADNPIVAGISLNVDKTEDIVLVEYDGATGAQIGAPATIGGPQDHDLPFHNLVAMGTSVVVAGTGPSFLTAAYQVSSSTYCDPSSPAPVASIESGPACAGETVQINASNYPGATYSWTGPNGFASTLRNPTLTATPAAAGLYSVVIHAYGCTLPMATTDLVVHPALSAQITASPVDQQTTVAAASVPDAGPGATYSWAIDRTFVSNGQGTSSITYSPPHSGVITISVAVTNANGCTENGSVEVPVAGYDFYTLAPCRLLDTRNPDGDLAGPALSAGGDRTFVLAGQCGIPATARAISANVTITQPTSDGDLRAYPVGSPFPITSVINYRPGQTRANNAVLSLGPSGDIAVHCDQLSGSVDLILDVNGYFQ